ncbi:hypothetical protein B9Z55_002835 [Caenorhabditis nigoni]|uniref:Sdz-33 F-box domain-containing protein n=1 Tax=Caenorhabditis nigoni TaxID=1611254 RepID=A0A2G5VMA8_9PELO|nr:hypothetical protein B9Z55_002835 [Caenorhabditis nigoni]
MAKLIRWNPIDIRLASDEEQQICLKLSKDPGLEWIIHYKKKWISPKYRGFESTLLGPQALHFLYLKDNGIDDMTQMMENICEVFRSPICEIHICEESLIEWIIKFQPIIRHVSISEDVITSVESLDRILKNLEVTEHFWLESIALDDHFQYNEPIPFRCITINDSYWLTLTSILNGNNSIIRLCDSKLTPTDINTILKEWQMGFKLRSLEYMEIETFTFLDINSYRDEVLKDLPNHVGNFGRPMTVKIHDEYTETLPHDLSVHNIIRGDGMILSILGDYEEFEGGKTKVLLRLQVWGQQI